MPPHIRTRAWRRAQTLRARARKSNQSDLPPRRFFIKHRRDLWRRRDRLYHDARTGGAFGVERQREDLLAWDDEEEEDT